MYLSKCSQILMCLRKIRRVLLQLMAIIHLLPCRPKVKIKLYWLFFRVLYFLRTCISFWVCVIWRFCCVAEVLEPILKAWCVLCFFIILHIKDRLLKLGNRISICYLLHFNSICSFSIYFVITYFSLRFVSLLNICVFLGCTYQIF